MCLFVSFFGINQAIFLSLGDLKIIFSPEILHNGFGGPIEWETNPRTSLFRKFVIWDPLVENAQKTIENVCQKWGM